MPIGQGNEILSYFDDHSRLLIAAHFANVTAGLFVVDTFRNTCNEFGLPASVLTDNRAVFTARMRKGRYIQKAVVSTTMGPGIAVDPNLVREPAVN